MRHNYIFILVTILFISILATPTLVYAEQSSSAITNDITDNSQTDEVCSGLLGDFKKDLESIMGIIRIAGPVLVIILTTVEFITAMTGKDDEAIKKSTSRLASRLILIAVLFLLPTILNIVLGLLDQKYTTCIR